MYSASNPLICGHTSTGFPCRLAKTESSGSLPMAKKMSLPTTVNSSDVLFQLPVEQIGQFPNCTWDAADFQLGIDFERDLPRSQDLRMLPLPQLSLLRLTHSSSSHLGCQASDYAGVLRLTNIVILIPKIEVDTDSCSKRGSSVNIQDPPHSRLPWVSPSMTTQHASKNPAQWKTGAGESKSGNSAGSCSYLFAVTASRTVSELNRDVCNWAIGYSRKTPTI